MLKTLGLILAGLLAGLAIVLVLPGGEADRGDARGFLDSPPQDGTPDERLASLQQALRSEAQARLALEARVEELASELESVRATGVAPLGRGGDAPASPASPAAGARLADLRGLEQRDGFATAAQRDGREQLSVEERRARDAERELERLVGAGFPRDRAEQIRRRSEELQFEVMQARYEAQRNGQPADSVPSRDQMLRRELGDGDYERLLRATGRMMDVNVVDVLASSPAERAGLKPGDQIVSYAGTRLFELSELNQLALEGNSGETVVVEVIRNGQATQLVLPRGPLGVTIQGSREGGGPGGGGGFGR
jgi:hypothetical protein